MKLRNLITEEVKIDIRKEYQSFSDGISNLGNIAKQTDDPKITHLYQQAWFIRDQVYRRLGKINPNWD